MHILDSSLVPTLDKPGYIYNIDTSCVRSVPSLFQLLCCKLQKAGRESWVESTYPTLDDTCI